MIEGNTIAFNNKGVQVFDVASVCTIDENYIHDNEIGVWIYNTQDSSISRNSIHDNEIGVWMETEAMYNSSSIRISANSIYENQRWLHSGLGIDLAPEGVNLNDLGDADVGPNGLLNFPVLGFAAVTADGDLRIVGSFDTGLGSKPYTIEFFANQVCDESGYGEGERFLGSSEVSTDFAGHATINTTFTQAAVPAGQFITATAIDKDGNTSEFSRCVEVLSGTILNADTAKGAATLETASTQGFAAGDFIRVNPGGENEEDNRIMGLGSIHLTTPLQFDHLTGEWVVNITRRLYLPMVMQKPATP